MIVTYQGHKTGGAALVTYFWVKDSHKVCGLKKPPSFLFCFVLLFLYLTILQVRHSARSWPGDSSAPRGIAWGPLVVFS